MSENILIAGAAGRTGSLIVNRLLQHGVQPHVLIRDLASAKKLFGDAVIYHQGDIRQIASLIEPMQSIQTVIAAVGASSPVGKNCPYRVDYKGVENLVKTAEDQGVKRFILISSIAVTHPNHPLNCFGKVLDWKFKGEEVLRRRSMTYAIIRPGGLLAVPGGKHNLVFDQGDQIMGTISREDVAEICIQAAFYPGQLQHTFEVIEGDQKREEIHWNTLLASLAFDETKVAPIQTVEH